MTDEVNPDWLCEHGVDLYGTECPVCNEAVPHEVTFARRFVRFYLIQYYKRMGFTFVPAENTLGELMMKSGTVAEITRLLNYLEENAHRIPITRHTPGARKGRFTFRVTHVDEKQVSDLKRILQIEF